MTTVVPPIPFADDPSRLKTRPILVPRHSGDLLVSRGDLSQRQKHTLEQLAFEYACVPQSYDIAISDGHVLQLPCGQGAVSVLTDGRFWHIAGGRSTRSRK